MLPEHNFFFLGLTKKAILLVVVRTAPTRYLQRFYRAGGAVGLGAEVEADHAAASPAAVWGGCSLGAGGGGGAGGRGAPGARLGVLLVVQQLLVVLRL